MQSNNEVKLLKQNYDNGFVHKVQKGQTLASIAKQYNQTKEALMKINNIKNSVEAGDRLFIPQKNKAVYVVKPLDTISKIAKKFNVSEKDILELNKTNNIFIGQILVI